SRCSARRARSWSSRSSDPVAPTRGAPATARLCSAGEPAEVPMSQPVEREGMEVDVLFVGAGPATLASAIHLLGRVEAWNRRAAARRRPPIEAPTVLVLEKGASVGDHMLSGAVMNPKAIRELVPDFQQQGFPTEHVCDYAGFWIYHPKGKLSVPVVPPN